MPSRGDGEVRHRSETHPTVIRCHSGVVELGRSAVQADEGIVPDDWAVSPLLSRCVMFATER